VTILSACAVLLTVLSDDIISMCGAAHGAVCDDIISLLFSPSVCLIYFY